MVPGVTEFVPLHDIPYIFLSPDKAPYLSIDEFLTSPDRHLDLSAFVPKLPILLSGTPFHN